MQKTSTIELTQEADSFDAILSMEATWNGNNKPAAEVPNVKEHLHSLKSAPDGDIEKLMQPPVKPTQTTQMDSGKDKSSATVEAEENTLAVPVAKKVTTAA